MKRTLFVLFILAAAKIFPQTYNYYFGNLHAHTGFSDGNKDSVVSGISKPDGSYAYAKLSEDFDFLGISEHNHYSTAKNPGFRKMSYQPGLSMADAANEDGNFLALFGMEYGVSSEYNGHVIIYGFSQLIGWETTVPGQASNNYDIFNAKTDYSGLFTKVKNNPDAFCYLAHPNFNDFSTDGTPNTSLANSPYNPVFDSAIVGVPLRSGLASSTATNYSNYSTGHYFNYYKKLLYQGYHIGIGYDHDNHYSNFGRSNGGRLVILAESLTRSNLVKAMKARNFYGSDDPNARINFSCDGKIMGTVINGNYFPSFVVAHSDPDGEQADTIKIWRGRKNSGGLWAEIVHISNQSDVTGFTDYNIKSFSEYYYFAEIRQKDGHWIVTSPIWFKSEVQLQAPESKIHSPLNCHHDQVNNILYLAAGQCGNHRFTLTDLTGCRSSEIHFDQPEYRINLSDLPKGVYLLEFQSGTSLLRKKICLF